MGNKVLILSEAIGHGHTKAAKALEQGITQLMPNVKVKMIEASDCLHPFTTNMMVRFYLKMIQFFPGIWRQIYQYHQDRPLAKWKKELIYFLFYRNMESMLLREQPQLVICTHSFSSVAMAKLKQDGFSTILCVAITDFHVHGVWVHPEVDFYLVASQHVADELIEMGVDANKILVTGIPSRIDFWTRKDKAAARSKFKLKNLPTVLIMGGGLGIGGMKEIAYAIRKWKSDIQIVICTGNNVKLKKELCSDPQFDHPHIRILGFVDEISEWMDVADLLVTKSGGLTCFEALLKGVPLCIYKPISGHEEKNCDFLVANRLAIWIRDCSQIDDWIQKLCEDPHAFAAMRQNIARFTSNIDPLACAKCLTQLLKQEQLPGRASVEQLRGCSVSVIPR